MKIANITGEQLQDFTFDVIPKYFISEEPVPVHNYYKYEILENITETGNKIII